MMQQLKAPPFVLQYLLAGAALLATSGLLFNNLPSQLPLEQTLNRSSAVCSEVVQPSSALSREQLAQLLTVPERSPRSEVQAIVKQPYCRLPSLNIRAGATTEREAYPLASDPQTSLVVVYEGKTYVGYGFKRN